MGFYEDMLKESGGLDAVSALRKSQESMELNILDDKGSPMTLQEGHQEILKSGAVESIAPIQEVVPAPVQPETAPAPQSPKKRGRGAKAQPQQWPAAPAPVVEQKPKKLISIIDRETFEGGEFFCDEIVFTDEGVVAILIDPSIKWSQPAIESKVIVRVDGKPYWCWTPGVAPFFPGLKKSVAIFFLEPPYDKNQNDD